MRIDGISLMNIVGSGGIFQAGGGNVSFTIADSLTYIYIPFLNFKYRYKYKQ